ncbi:hypothetical protein IMCC1989_1981 [gamma proteobacterium IMCC1989]|nr:hypothetical protein IMCC1989_1981 [gamma proteobacterium IMCC1989]
MNGIKSTSSDITILNGYASKSAARDKAWKEELEKQIYQKNSMHHVDHESSKKSHYSMMIEQEIVDKKNTHITKGGEQQTENRKENSFLTIMAPDSKTESLTSLTEKKINHITADAFFSFSHTNSNQKTSLEKIPTNNLGGVDWSTIRVEKKEILLKLLPDGEILVRNYLEGKTTIKDMTAFVRSVKDMFGNNIEKIKVNGNTVWQDTLSISQKERNNHSINLIY